MITALSVSRAGCSFAFPDMAHRCLAGRVFATAEDVQRAWFDAVQLVDTPYFFFLDDDDSLPKDYARVLQRCMDTGAGVAYTDELVNGERRVRVPYAQAAHLQDTTLLHHLVLCDTALAKAVIEDLPRGHYWPEMMLYWEMAKSGGAAYVDDVGYLWHKQATGLHLNWFTVRGMANSRAWCAANP